MAELDEETWTEAAREYQRVQHFAMMSTSALILLFFGFIIVFFLAVALNAHPGIPTVLFLVFFPAICLCGLWCSFASSELHGFRCPRCGKNLTVTWWNKWPGDRCKHCRLDLTRRETAKTKPKPVKAADLLE